MYRWRLRPRVNVYLGIFFVQYQYLQVNLKNGSMCELSNHTVGYNLTKRSYIILVLCVLLINLPYPQYDIQTAHEIVILPSWVQLNNCTQVKSWVMASFNIKDIVWHFPCLVSIFRTPGTERYRYEIAQLCHPPKLDKIKMEIIGL